MGNQTISVALCSFNGEKYLPEQLDSIARQRRLPDELIVCDDKSTDGTLDVITKFAASASFPVKVVRNETNLGCSKNFEKAISLCTQDIISLADQDDVWHCDKLAVTHRILGSSSEIGCVFTNGNVVDENLVPAGYTLWDSFEFSETDRARFLSGSAFNVLLNHNVVTGATMAFHSHLRSKVLPIPPLWVHDSWIALLLSILSVVWPINMPLIDYRQHARQQIGGLKKSLAQQLLISRATARYDREIDQYRCILKHLLNAKFLSTHNAISQIEDKIDHLSVRGALYRTSLLSRISKATNELRLRRYHRYSRGYKSFLKDMMASVHYV